MEQLQEQMVTQEAAQHGAAARSSLQDSINRLAAYGGIRLLKSLVRDADSMDPRKRAPRNIFLTDPLYADQRAEMMRSLDAWIELLTPQESDDSSHWDRVSLVERCQEEIQRSENLLSDNLYNVREQIHPLEVAYRTLSGFFSNAGEVVTCLNVIDINKDQLADLTTPDSQAIIEELRNNYDVINLKKSYSLLVIPGYLNANVDERVLATLRRSADANEKAVGLRGWAKVAHLNKVLLITDFEDCEQYSDLVKRLEIASLQASDVEMSNVIMTCNYVLARPKSEIVMGEEDLYIPASALLAGRLCDTDQMPISQGVAGPRYGCVKEAPTVRFSLLKSELTLLIDQGVVPFIDVDGRVVAFSNYTLYNGSVPGLKEYPVVRVFDWVSKVIQHYCNMEALTVWDAQMRGEMMDRLQEFLNRYKGPGKLFENYAIKDIQQEPETKNIIVQVALKPFYAAKDFLIELTGQNETGNMQWTQSIQY